MVVILAIYNSFLFLLWLSLKTLKMNDKYLISQHVFSFVTNESYLSPTLWLYNNIIIINTNIIILVIYSNVLYDNIPTTNILLFYMMSIVIIIKGTIKTNFMIRIIIINKSLSSFIIYYCIFMRSNVKLLIRWRFL